MANLVAFIVGFLVLVPTFEVLVVARLLQGVVAGFGSSLAPLIMKETSPTEISGTLTSFHQIFAAFGVFFAFIFSLFISLLMNDATG
jgi:MFS family permease